MPTRLNLAYLGPAAAVLLLAAPALGTGAEVKKACVAAADQGQALRGDGKLVQAREQFVRCSRDECPGPLRQDCAKWMNETVAAIPSVVVGAHDGSGRDLVEVRVVVDGKLAAERLDGKPIDVDPGVHQFRYERPDGTVVEDRVVVRQGEQNRALTVTFGKKGGEPGSSSSATPKSKPESPPASGEQSSQTSTPALAWVLGGVGVAALGTALYLDLSANSRVVDLRSSCAPNCAQSDVDSVRRRYTIAGVAAGVGVVSLGVATYLFLHRSSQESAPSAGYSIDIVAAPHAASAALSGRF